MTSAPTSHKIRRALISVSDKSGLVELGKALADLGIEILSTGGTATALKNAGLQVKDVAEHTGFPEMMDGRLKTLHPKVHGGLLAIRDNPEHDKAAREHDIGPIDLLIVNLYPFEATVAKGAGFEECVENIDIGGPAMIRAAAKNHASVTVIVDAVKEARKIFQRMNSYAIYRIAETVRVLLFMTLSILVFNFYPVTAIMIVLLALLNDGAILSIAYDNVRPSPKPESWDMRLVLGVSTVLGITGVAASFGLFYIGEHVLHLDREVVQTLMYLKLSVAGHFNIFVTRTRGPFWSIAPAPILLIAVFGTQVIATVIAIYGLLMPAIGWDLAALVWGYAVVWFLINDRAKLLAYRILDHEAAPVIDQRKMAGM